MFFFNPKMEMKFAQCTPFDEGDIAQSADYEEARRELAAFRKFMERRTPDVLECVDKYMDIYMELVDLECRHYFQEGCRIGSKKVVQLSITSKSSKDNPS